MTSTRCGDVRHGSARFCPRCGAPRDAERRRRPARRTQGRRLGRVGSGCLVVVGLVAGIQGWVGDLSAIDPMVRERADTAGEPTGNRADEVTLPERSDEVGRAGDAGASGAAAGPDPLAGSYDGQGRRYVRDVGAEAAGVAACRPHGCVRWERRINGLLTASDGAVHVVDDRQVRTYDAADGTLRWRRSLLDPLPSGAAPDGFAVYPPPVAIDARAGVVVTASGHRIVTLDRDGNFSWTFVSEADDPIELVRLVADGHVVSATRADGPGPSRMRVAGLDAATGAERWQRPVTAVLDIDDEVVTVLDAGGALAGLRASDGRLRWRRAATSDPTAWASLLAGRDTASTSPTTHDARHGDTGSGATAVDRRAAHPADRRLANGVDRAQFQAIVVGFAGGSVSIRGAQPEVLLEDPSVVAVDERLLGIGHDG
jgi:outer membrane protein assembly factor BamB